METDNNLMDSEELNKKFDELAASSGDEIDIDDEILVCISIGKRLKVPFSSDFSDHTA